MHTCIYTYILEYIHTYNVHTYNIQTYNKHTYIYTYTLHHSIANPARGASPPTPTHPERKPAPALAHTLSRSGPLCHRADQGAGQEAAQERYRKLHVVSAGERDVILPPARPASSPAWGEGAERRGGGREGRGLRAEKREKGRGESREGGWGR